MKIFKTKERGFLFVKDLRKEINPIKPLIKNLSIIKLILYQVLDNLEINEELSERIKFALQSSKEAFVGIIDKKVIHTSFIDYDHPIGVILFGGFTQSEFRGKHIMPAVDYVIFNYLKDKGIRRLYASCARDNLSSKVSVLRAGFRRLNLWERIVIKVKIWLKKTKFIIFT